MKSPAVVDHARPDADRVRLIAFYLPQYHPIVENDAWWGRGFTEWTNVVKARPLFSTHYQPHLPADLGFYDLRLPEVRQAQADLARRYGIHGFCYYHYWFTGRRLLERPFNQVLASGQPDFPFCLCWANESWTRAWDGWSDRVLMAQSYSSADDAAHIRSLMPALRDPRYIRIGGRPLLLVYRAEHLPDPVRTATIWREAVARAGLGDLYLARVESFIQGVDPGRIGFDAAVEFAPDWDNLGPRLRRGRLWRLLTAAGVAPSAYAAHRIHDYRTVSDRAVEKPAVEYVRFRSVTPSWDNSPRRAKEAVILHNSTPEKYGAWLRAVVEQTAQHREDDERIVFINAWNEWAEGNHLEPDQRWGSAYLQATLDALTPRGASSERTTPSPVAPADLLPAR